MVAGAASPRAQLGCGCASEQLGQQGARVRTVRQSAQSFGKFSANEYCGPVRRAVSDVQVNVMDKDVTHVSVDELGDRAFASTRDPSARPCVLRYFYPGAFEGGEAAGEQAAQISSGPLPPIQHLRVRRGLPIWIIAIAPRRRAHRRTPQRATGRFGDRSKTRAPHSATTPRSSVPAEKYNFRTPSCSTVAR